MRYSNGLSNVGRFEEHYRTIFLYYKSKVLVLSDL
jgi:hypothetical protein